MRLRSGMRVLVLATALPLVLFAVVVSVLDVRQDQDDFVRVVRDRNRAFMTAADAELAGHLASTRQLTALRSFRADDLTQIRRDLEAALATQPDWTSIVVLSADGRQLINTAVPEGAPLPQSPFEKDSFHTVVDTALPVIGAVAYSRFAATYVIPIRVPLVRDGKVAYVVTANVKQAAFEALLRRQAIPQGWVGGIEDAKGQFVARVPPRAPGSLPARVFLDAVAKSPEGWNRMTTLEGIDNFSAHKTSDVTHWTVSIAVPASIVLAGTYRAGIVLTLGALVSLAIGFGIAFVLGRLITRPIMHLASSAGSIGSGMAVRVPPTNIEEVKQLAGALESASAAIRVRQELADQQRAALAAADRAKDEFIAMLSHELRNPLAALASASQVLGAVPSDNPTVDAMQAVIQRQTQHMTRLVEDLLDVSRIATGKITLEPKATDLAEVVDGVVRAWERSGRLAERTLSTQLETVWMQGDRARLEQVVGNLLGNAVKFTTPGGRIAVTLDKCAQHARLVVADDGAGIPAETLSRVFELFVQGPQGLSRDRGGLGVGLAVVQRLVQLHDGTVQAESDGIGRGSRFTVLVPAIDTPASVPNAPAREFPIVVRSVLLVEDNDDARSSLATLLEMEGFTVQVVASGEAAMKILARTALPDMILIDIGLPGMNGYELARRVRELPGGAACTLIAVTGYGQREDVQRSFAAGFDEHVTKPLKVNTLRESMLRAESRRSNTARVI